MWEYTNTNELYHYGVKGMKWGVRKARNIYIRRLERKKRKDDTNHKIDKVLAEFDPRTHTPEGQVKRRQKEKAYKHESVKTNWKIAKNKAKNDPNYKNSDEYKRASKEYGKQRVMDAIRDIQNLGRKDF